VPAEGSADFDIVVSDAPTTAVEAVDGDSLQGEDGTSYRLIGINAPDDPECGAGEAAARLASLVQDPVVLESGAEPFDQFGRHLVYAFRPQGSPGFINAAMVEEGLAIALHSQDSDQVDELFAVQQRARDRAAGLWDPQACGTGPLAPIEVVDSQTNPPGPDEDVLDAEWIEVSNAGSEPIDLTGWTIRDESTQNRFRFPPRFILGPGERVTVTAGEGEFGFGLGAPIWNNGGDTVLVVDDQGRFVTYLAVAG
jgi:endonuclease YncB( thermonuclease family)